MSPTVRVEPARAEEREAALGLIFQHLPDAERGPRVANALTLVAQGELDPEGLLVARRGGTLVGAMVVLLLPGSSGLVWPPQALEESSADPILNLLIQHALHWLRRRGAKVGQAILVPEEAERAAPLAANGFRHVTSLWYLRHRLRWPDPETKKRFTACLHRRGVVFRAYPDCDPAIFQETLLQTYEGSQDCPELNGVRDPADVLAGHRGQGRHDPGRWWLLLEDGRPAGVLLLTAIPEWDALDISYLGVVPEARGRSLGQVLAARALQEAGRAGVAQLTLAVDSRNRPAWDLYHALGFEAYERREVYLALWDR